MTKTKAINLPKAWKDLLRLKLDASVAESPPGAVDPYEKTPYRNDYREVYIEVDEWNCEPGKHETLTITAALESDDERYDIRWYVMREREETFYTERERVINDEQEIVWTDKHGEYEDVIVVPVKLVYSYLDLSPEAQDRVRREYIEGWLETHPGDEDFAEEAHHLLKNMDPEYDRYLEDGTDVGGDDPEED